MPCPDNIESLAERVERHMRDVLTFTGGHQRKASVILDITEHKMYKLVKSFGIDPTEYYRESFSVKDGKRKKRRECFRTK